MLHCPWGTFIQQYLLTSSVSRFANSDNIPEIFVLIRYSDL